MIGKTLGHYQIIEKLGTGGMGEVYRAYYEHLQRDVAAKVLPSGTLADDAARKDALALSRLNHPKYRDGARLRHSGWNRLSRHGIHPRLDAR